MLIATVCYIRRIPHGIRWLSMQNPLIIRGQLRGYLRIICAVVCGKVKFFVSCTVSRRVNHIATDCRMFCQCGTNSTVYKTILYAADKAYMVESSYDWFCYIHAHQDQIATLDLPPIHSIWSPSHTQHMTPKHLCLETWVHGGEEGMLPGQR